MPGQDVHLGERGGVILGLLEFFDSIGISQGVESVFTGSAAGRDISDHNGLTVSGEGIFKNESQFASSEGSMLLVLV